MIAPSSTPLCLALFLWVSHLHPHRATDPALPKAGWERGKQYRWRKGLGRFSHSPPHLYLPPTKAFHPPSNVKADGRHPSRFDWAVRGCCLSLCCLTPPPRPPPLRTSPSRNIRKRGGGWRRRGEGLGAQHCAGLGLEADHQPFSHKVVPKLNDDDRSIDR